MTMLRSFYPKLGLIVALLVPMIATAQETHSKDEKNVQKRGQSAAELNKKISRLEQQIEVAKLELQATKISVLLKKSKTNEAARSAAFALQMAKQSLTTFTEVDAPVKISEAKVSFDQAKNRATLAQDELQELIAMYKADEFAEMTKELVLKRGRKNAEFAKRRLNIQAKKMKRLKEIELPKQQKELENKIQQAQEKLKTSQFEVKKMDIDIRILNMKANNKIQNLTSDLRGLREKLAKTSANSQ